MKRDLTLLNRLWNEVIEAQMLPPAKGAEHHTAAAIDCLEQWLPVIEKVLNQTRDYAWRVLDVGCGRGELQAWWEGRGWDWRGVDAKCHSRSILPVDYHFWRPGHTSDLVFCRHVVEHSPMPLLAITKLWEFTAPDGWCIIITPLPPANADYPDHFSVMSRSAWISLFRRVGFVLADYAEAPVGDGSMEMRFLLRKADVDHA